MTTLLLKIFRKETKVTNSVSVSVYDFSYSFVAVFNEGRVVVAVTKMDESYRAVSNDDRISETRVKEIVSREIQRTLKLDRVSPEIIFPLCGDFALQVCVHAYTVVGFSHFFSLGTCHR